MIIRQCLSNEYRIVEEVTRDSFWDIYKPGCDEHLMVHKLRQRPAYIPELDVVACIDEKIVGHIFYTRAYVVSDDGIKHECIAFGPLSVLPEYRKQGIGAALIEESKALAKKMGFRAIFIYGNPKYYHRFGFRNAEVFGITTPTGKNFEAFMGLEITEHGLDGITGKLYEDEGYTVDKQELDDFEMSFPHREKLHKGRS